MRRLIFTAVLSTVLLAAGAAPAYAGSEPNEGSVKMYFKHDGQIIPVDDEYLAAHTLNLDAPMESNPGEIAPQLINFDQWVDCFSLNNEQSLFAEYRHLADEHDVNLRCGTEGWGYKHIRLGKESAWQAKLNGAIAVGWDPASQGFDGWDDLMASAAGIAILWPDYTQANNLNQTKCGVSEIIFRDSATFEVVYSFYARAAWATDSDRLITTFPQSLSYC